MFPKRKRCALILGKIKDAPNQSTLKEKQWREYNKYIYMSLWQKVLPLNPVYSYLFSSYYSYMKLWLLLFSMHWWVVKVKIGSFGHQEED